MAIDICFGLSGVCESFPTESSLLLWPFSSGVQHTQHAHRVTYHVINQNVPLVHYQFASTAHTATPTEAGTIDQATGLLLKELVERQGCSRALPSGVLQI